MVGVHHKRDCIKPHSIRKVENYLTSQHQAGCWLYRYISEQNTNNALRSRSGNWDQYSNTFLGSVPSTTKIKNNLGESKCPAHRDVCGPHTQTTSISQSSSMHASACQPSVQMPDRAHSVLSWPVVHCVLDHHISSTKMKGLAISLVSRIMTPPNGPWNPSKEERRHETFLNQKFPEPEDGIFSSVSHGRLRECNKWKFSNDVKWSASSREQTYQDFMRLSRC